jgi:hypothetical protein
VQIPYRINIHAFIIPLSHKKSKVFLFYGIKKATLSPLFSLNTNLYKDSLSFGDTAEVRKIPRKPLANILAQAE